MLSSSGSGIVGLALVCNTVLTPDLRPGVGLDFSSARRVSPPEHVLSRRSGSTNAVSSVPDDKLPPNRLLLAPLRALAGGDTVTESAEGG